MVSGLYLTVLNIWNLVNFFANNCHYSISLYIHHNNDNNNNIFIYLYFLGSTHQLWASLNIRSSPGSRPQTNLSTRRAFQRLSSLQSSSTMMAMMPPPASPLPFHVLESRTGSPLPPEVLQQSIMSQISPLNEL